MTVSLFYCTAEFTASNTKHSNVNKCCAKSNTMLSLTQLCVCVLARPTGRRRPSLSPVPLEDQTQHSRQKQSRRSCISPSTFTQTNNKLQLHTTRTAKCHIAAATHRIRLIILTAYHRGGQCLQCSGISCLNLFQPIRIHYDIMRK